MTPPLSRLSDLISGVKKKFKKEVSSFQENTGTATLGVPR
jgi:hypothetical protein